MARLTVDRESDIVRLVHYTTQEYFERIRSERFPHAEQRIVTICLSYLSFDIFQEGHCPSDEGLDIRLQRHALLNYAARHWGAHVHGDVEQAVNALALEFLTSDPKVSCSAQVMLTPEYRYEGYSRSCAKRVSGIHICAYFGLQTVITGLLEIEITADVKDSYGQTPLSYAAGGGYEAVVRLLVHSLPYSPTV
jgi:hypothetical protein